MTAEQKLYRVIEGAYAGWEGAPVGLSPDGERVSLMLQGGEIWFLRSAVRRLRCMVLNCATYTWDNRHGHCSQCTADGKAMATGGGRDKFKELEILLHHQAVAIGKQDLPAALKIYDDALALMHEIRRDLLKKKGKQ